MLIISDRSIIAVARMALDEAGSPTLIKLAEEKPFSLGLLEVRPATREVAHPEGRKVLEPRIMQVLVALARANGEVMSREELTARCWNGQVVGENAIQRAISKIRSLGQAYGEAFTVETIARVGYRLIVQSDAGGAPPAAIMAPESTSRGLVLPRRSAAALSLGGVVLAAGLAAGLAWRPNATRGQVADLIRQGEQVMKMGTADADAQGVGFLEEAVALDPRNSLAWGRLALARSAAAEYSPPDLMAGVVAATQEAAQRALALDRRQADALSALALLPHYYGDWLAAEQRMQSVLDIHPGHLPTRDARAFFHVAVGLARKGSTDRLTIAASDPLNANYQFKLIYAQWILGDIGGADRTAERTLQLWPKHPPSWFARLWTLAFTGRPERALAHLADESGRPELPPPFVEMLHRSMTALSTQRPEDISQAVDLLLEFLSWAPNHSINAVILLNALNEIDLAFDVAEAYLLERGPILARVRWRKGETPVHDGRRRKTSMMFIPVSARMRSDPRFDSLVEEMGLADYWRRAGVTPDYQLAA